MLCSSQNLLMCAVTRYKYLGIAAPPVRTPSSDRACDANLSKHERTRKGHPALAVLDATGSSRGRTARQTSRAACWESTAPAPWNEYGFDSRQVYGCRGARGVPRTPNMS